MTKLGFRQMNARRLVRAAVIRGDLKKLDGSTLCVDCNEPARVYDHRDYRKPLSVDPVCYKCNKKRGHGLPAPEKHVPVTRTYIKKNGVSVTEIDTYELRCLRCGGKWISRKPNPARCGKAPCRSPYWNRPRKKK